jgi:hypothetical protein
MQKQVLKIQLDLGAREYGVRKYDRAVGAIRSLRSRGNKVSAESPAQLLPDAEITCPRA